MIIIIIIIPLNIDVNQDIRVNQLPTQGQKVEVMKEKANKRIRPFQLPKPTSYEVAANMGQPAPNLTQQPVMDFYPRSVRNVPQDPITQHTDQRAKPKVYESLIRPMPVDVQLQGTLPPYDVDKIWEEFDWTPPKDQDQERKPLFKHIPDYQIFRALSRDEDERHGV